MTWFLKILDGRILRILLLSPRRSMAQIQTVKATTQLHPATSIAMITGECYTYVVAPPSSKAKTINTDEPSRSITPR